MKRDKNLYPRRKSRFGNQRRPKPTIWFKVDPHDERTLILKNGCRIRQGFDGVGLYASRGGKVYALTSQGLREKRINYCRNKGYLKRTCTGHKQGQRYPYVKYRDKTYRVHLLVAYAWIGPKPEGCDVDHINGNIDDCRLINLRIITKKENRRCAGILKRLRKASRDLRDTKLHPRHIPPTRLLIIFATITPNDPAKIMERDMTEHREF